MDILINILDNIKLLLIALNNLSKTFINYIYLDNGYEIKYMNV